MALNLADRLLTVVVTATLTSAAWIVVGSSYVDRIGPAPTPASPRPQPSSSVETPAPGPSAVRASSEGLVVPVAGVAVTQLHSTFNETRGGSRPHEALDIMAPAGTAVLAAAAGKVEKLFLSDAGGKTVYVRSSDRRTIYYYAHLREYEAGLTEGEDVERGERLGTVGSTGNADPAAPHLHFAIMRTSPEAEWWEHATAIDPYPLLAAQ